MAEDAAARLDAGSAPAAVVSGDSVELASSLAPYLIVFDRSGHVLASSVTVHGGPPNFPEGVFGHVPSGGVETVTWQTATGERSATAVTAYGGGYVVAGRSLREVESRDLDSELLAVFGWFGMLAATRIRSSTPIPVMPSGVLSRAILTVIRCLLATHWTLKPPSPFVGTVRIAGWPFTVLLR